MSRFREESLERLRQVLRDRPAVEIEAPQFRRASVLLPLIRNSEPHGGWSILFSRRSSNLAAHSGQIAFPGGGAERGESLAMAAVRETEEEVGIPPTAVELIGRLDDVVTNTGFLVAPFVGLVAQPVEYVLQASEVDEVFEVPVDALLQPGQPEVRYVGFSNGRYPAYFYQYDRFEIWGLTGRMLKAFLDLVWVSL